MYKSETQLKFEFELPFDGALSKNNRWIMLAGIIPWDELEAIAEYSQNFGHNGNTALNFRVAFGALLIQTKLKLTDEETVEQIKENPYLQYFIGTTKFTEEAPFNASLMVAFRKRLDKEIMLKLNERIVKIAVAPAQEERKEANDEGSFADVEAAVENAETIPSEQPQNQGTLILDATCAPAAITYPTDLKVLGQARESSERIIDEIHKRMRKSGSKRKKARTHCKIARKKHVAALKQRKLGGKKLHKALRGQLNYLARNLKTIKGLIETVGAVFLSISERSRLETLIKVYEQQREMNEKKTHRVADRIVSVSQPHIRPIVRGKAGAAVEFGAKVSVAIDNGDTYVERLNWDNFNEGITLQESVERYYERHGFYPEVVCADKIYRTRENLRYCKERGIRLSGPSLGRPSSEPEKQEEQKRIEYQDSCTRNAVEGKFGEGKQAYSLGYIRCKLKETSETMILLQFLVMNLWGKLRKLCQNFFCANFAQNSPVFFCVFAVARKVFVEKWILAKSVIHNLAQVPKLGIR